MNTKLQTLWEESFGRKPETMQEKMFLQSVMKYISEQEDFTLSRLEDWLNGKPEPAITKFTAGKLRNVARLIEDQRILPITEEINERVLALHMIGNRLVDFEAGTIVDCEKIGKDFDISKPSEGTIQEHLAYLWLEFGSKFAVVQKYKPPFSVTHYIPISNPFGNELPF